MIQPNDKRDYNASLRDKRARRRERKQCAWCGKQDGRTLDGMQLCDHCESLHIKYVTAYNQRFGKKRR